MTKQPLILVIHGREDSLILYHQVLLRAGYDVVLAAAADEGLEQARRHRPDLILMDPTIAGAGNVSLARKLREDAAVAGTPIAALAADSLDPESPLRDADFCGVIAPRLPLQALLDAVRRCLDTAVGASGWAGLSGGSPAPA